MLNKNLFVLILALSFVSGQTVATVAGSGTAGYNDSNTGNLAKFNNPQGTAVDAAGNIYVADKANNRVRKITASGVVTTLAGSSYGFLDGTGTDAKFRYPSDVAVDISGNIYVADSYNHRIRKITPTGVVSTLAGDGYTGSSDGTGSSARFYYPSGIAVDSDGNIYIADKNNNRIRKISAAGVVTTLAGSSYGYFDGSGDDAKFRYPLDLAVDATGNVYVADTDNHTIRKILPDGTVTTIAGSGSSGSTDGTGTQASFNSPSGVTVDNSGNIYVADKNNNRIRKVASTGVVTTVAGSTPGFFDGAASDALFYNPFGISVFGSSHLYVGDLLNHRIRAVSLDATNTTPETVAFTLAGGSSAYNISVTTSNNGGTTGGVKLTGSEFTIGNTYIFKASFNQGTSWSPIASVNAVAGTFLGSGVFNSDASGNIQLEISHSTLLGMAEWPGNDGTITLRVSDSTETYFFPNSSGQQFTIDLTQPSITSASIVSNNINNNTYAKVDDIITVSFQSSEMLGNTVLPISGNINGNAITATGSGSAWQAFATVGNIDAEGISTFEITYYDINGNVGSTTLTSTTDGSSVTVDKSSPLATNITIFSSNANNTQAETGDTITVEFSINEDLNNLTDV